MNSIQTAGRPGQRRPETRPTPLLRRAAQLPEVRWAATATGLFLIGALTQLTGAPAWVWWACYLLCYAAGGWEPALAGLRALRQGTLDVDLLMVVAAVLAASIGQVLDGALLIVIFATSGALEAVATARTQDSVRALLTLTPETATRVEADGSEREVAAADLTVGDLVLIRPGGLISADGLVVDGVSDVDQASITGESMPVLKQPDAQVFAGTLNGTGLLTVRVARPAAESVVARIAALVDEAAQTKSRTQLFIDKIEQRYSIAMVTATVALLVVPLLFGAAFEPTLLRAMTFMIVASPCAVVLATMPPLLAAIANAGRHGVLIKSAVVMEQLGTVTVAAFDKTGTLTEGTPHLIEIHLLPGAEFAHPDEVLRLAAAAERASEHPLGRAVVTAATDREIKLPTASGFSSQPGRGVTATIDGYRVTVGSPAVMDSDKPNDDIHVAPRTMVDNVQAAGRTAVVVIVDRHPVAVLALTDRLRPAAPAAVSALADITGHPPILLTGDAPGPAHAIAADAGIQHVHPELMPHDKITHVRAEQAAGARVLLIGDGVNDAPALAAADVGIAMGRHGSDLALETADAVIVRDDLATVPAAVALSRRARRVVKANLVIAATFITALSLWDLFGHLPLPLGVLGHEGSTVIVGLNGLRLLRSQAWPKVPTTAHQLDSNGR